MNLNKDRVPRWIMKANGFTTTSNCGSNLPGTPVGECGDNQCSFPSRSHSARSDKAEAEMGNYIVNGEVIDVRGERPTAADLKHHANSVLSDWVMASMPNGQIVKLEDHKPLPANAVDYSVVTPFTYG
jgi:hypothetical protein